MKYIAAYALLLVGGNAAPSQDDVKAVITAAGGEADEEKVSKLFADLEGKDINELLKEGQEKLKTVNIGGGGGGKLCRLQIQYIMLHIEELYHNNIMKSNLRNIFSLLFTIYLL